MSLRIITADQRLAEANGKTTIALFGPSGVGKTTLLNTLPPAETLCIDLEAGLKSVQRWPGESISIRTFADAADIACLIGGINPAAPDEGFFSAAHFHYLIETHTELASRIAGKRIIFVDSITDLTRQAMAWAKTRPEAFSEKTGRPDTRGAFGLLAREVIALLKHLQHAPGRTVIFVGILERVVDDFNREQWQPQMEGGKAGRELPGIVDQVISMSLFEPEPAPNFSLDRIDPEGNYEPGNCRWAPIEVQNRNRKGVRWYDFEGQPALIQDIAKFLGISRDEARALERRGLLPAQRLAEPPRVPDSIEPLVLDLNGVAPYSKSDDVVAHQFGGDR